MWEKELDTVRLAAQEAGDIINSLYGRVDVIKKKGDIDLVTEADLQAESKIVEVITRAFPQDSLVTEEAGHYDHHSKRIWLIDPLDGTTNFTHAFPFFGISIALEIEKRVVVGAVYDPLRDEYFCAAEGTGAFLNGNRIKVSTIGKLEDSLLATGFPYEVYNDAHELTKRFEKMLTLTQGVRRPGSAALDLCYVAAGRVDGYWEERLFPWDTAAGSIIVKEAGGQVTDYTGKTYTPYSRTILATNGLIHAEMMEALKI
ncbi:MAG: inositol monophosphatase [Deltaproteobacteria bacterium]|nr:inositol monophosphatase [Deltaproteobacteria bacterium]MBW1918894.1 inositol monophosphatase [Deltaproteobacteria bacterium]MBW1934672.1 inositol monophosphatase [Deltaproteobacteria bacterium]MBW1976954.1 inositol monophosphatase [Deltaproteobacteria bacterium]MBW2043538.1 inositol monophosphatase [Deltaproteobacteria bacterium]